MNRKPSGDEYRRGVNVTYMDGRQRVKVTTYLLQSVHGFVGTCSYWYSHGSGVDVCFVAWHSVRKCKDHRVYNSYISGKGDTLFVLFAFGYKCVSLECVGSTCPSGSLMYTVDFSARGWEHATGIPRQV